MSKEHKGSYRLLGLKRFWLVITVWRHQSRHYQCMSEKVADNERVATTPGNSFPWDVRPSARSNFNQFSVVSLVNKLTNGDQDLRADARGLQAVLGHVDPVRLPCLQIMENQEVGSSVFRPVVEVVVLRFVVSPALEVPLIVIAGALEVLALGALGSAGLHLSPGN